MDELNVMRSFLAWMMAPPLYPSWENLLKPKDRFAIRATYFLLDIDKLYNVENFLTYSLGRLLRHLDHSTKQQQVDYQGRVRGQIAWQTTFKKQSRQNYVPNYYVCREVQHQYNTLENQLLKYVVERISNCLKAVPPILRAGACYFPATNGCSPLATVGRLTKIEVALNQARRNLRLRDITLPREINQLHLIQAENTRIYDYITVTNIYRHYQVTVESTSWEEMKNISKRVLPLPGEVNFEGELWIKISAGILRD